MSHVQLLEDGDSRAFRWGDLGRKHYFRLEEEAADAYSKAVAEGLAGGEVIEGELEREVARDLGGRIGVRKDAADSIVIAYWLPEELATALQKNVGAGAVAAADMHLTLIYVGDPDADGGKYDVELIAAVCKVFSTRAYPCEATIAGLGRFVGPEDTDFVVALVDSPDIERLRRQLLDELMCCSALPWQSAAYQPTHGYVPHVTLANVAKGQPTQVQMEGTLDFTIDNISVASGPQRAVFPISGAMPMDEADSPALYASRSAGQRDLSDTDHTPPPDALVYKAAETDDAMRYTMGPLYAPNRKDAHGEYVEPEVLQKAVHDYVRESASEGRRLWLQHGDSGPVTVGEWVEVTTWPYDHTIKLRTHPDGEEREVEMPAGTVYMGIVWDEDAWPLVKAGKLGGLSLGGRAVRVASPGIELPDMGDMSKSTGEGDTAESETG